MLKGNQKRTFAEMKEMTERQNDDHMLKGLQWQTFAYFLNETNPVNALVADKPGPSGRPALPRPD